MKKHYLIYFGCLFLFCYCDNNKIKEYYKNGELKKECQIEDGMLNGHYIEYYENGNLKSESNFKDNKLEGIKKVYYKNGQIEWAVYYHDNKENGICKSYSEDGILLSKVHFKKGKQHGKCLFYYPDGKLQSEVEFKDGHEQGKYISFFSNGKIELDAIIENNVTIYYKEYNEQGELIDQDRSIVIVPKTDTIIKKGEEFVAEIEVKGPLQDIVIIKAGVFSNILEETIDVKIMPQIENHEGKAVYSYKADKSGIFYLNVHVFVLNKGEIPDIFFVNYQKIIVNP